MGAPVNPQIANQPLAPAPAPAAAAAPPAVAPPQGAFGGHVVQQVKSQMAAPGGGIGAALRAVLQAIRNWAAAKILAMTKINVPNQSAIGAPVTSTVAGTNAADEKEPTKHDALAASVVARLESGLYDEAVELLKEEFKDEQNVVDNLADILVQLKNDNDPRSLLNYLDALIESRETNDQEAEEKEGLIGVCQDLLMKANCKDDPLLKAIFQKGASFLETLSLKELSEVHSRLEAANSRRLAKNASENQGQNGGAANSSAIRQTAERGHVPDKPSTVGVPMHAEVVQPTPRGQITEEEVGDNMKGRTLPSRRDPAATVDPKVTAAMRNAPVFTPYNPESATVPVLPSRIPDLPARGNNNGSASATVSFGAGPNSSEEGYPVLLVTEETDTVDTVTTVELEEATLTVDQDIDDTSNEDVHAVPSKAVISSQNDLFGEDEDDDFDDDDDVSTRRANLTKALSNTVDGTPVSSVQRTVGKLDAGTVSDLAERLSGKKEEN